MTFEIFAQALANGLVSGTVLAVPAIGFTAIFAIRGYPNFMIGAIATVGAYAGWMANTGAGLSIWPSIAIAFLAAGAIGLVTEKVAVRPPWLLFLKMACGSFFPTICAASTCRSSAT